MEAVDTLMLVTTADEIPGKKLDHLGHVFGITVRARNVGVNIGAGLKALAGGEVKAMTTNFERSRKEALDRMIGMAHQRGADAIVAMRFDSTGVSVFSEVCAYGTAVKYVKD